MTDIVERLRKHLFGRTGTAIWEAADEIKRLRVEIERLTRERDDAKADHVRRHQDAAQWQMRAEAAEREANELIEEMKQRRDEFALYRIAAERKVEMLREALQVLLEDHNYLFDDKENLATMTARNALKETEANEP